MNTSNEQNVLNVQNVQQSDERLDLVKMRIEQHRNQLILWTSITVIIGLCWAIWLFFQISDENYIYMFLGILIIILIICLIVMTWVYYRRYHKRRLAIAIEAFQKRQQKKQRQLQQQQPVWQTDQIYIQPDNQLNV